MMRRGVEANAVSLMQESEQDEIISSDDTSQPLLKRNHFVKLKETGFKQIRSIWYEFCMDLGWERLLVLLLVVLCLSLYVAYMVTGLASHVKTSIPIVSENVKPVEV